ncbi:peroxidase-related enzyme [Marinoscillum furvescens]|uniref:Putative peroxidase-related enzyme n=1 Tax=Marinoscillum furvescens DSM 4134 TaxID=1122208 RepID=A0A3D9L0A7_MARFU|nr:peroxidase-related enzyme [Marinoscillum furvescens]RED95583.1 putative peroxidase-related enzyme [Marinoscillum furvescens DSM 4134]
MTDSSKTPILISEEEASGRVAEIYQRIKQGFQIAFVPNFFKAQAIRPDLLENTWENVERILIKEEYLPRTIKEMMFTAISKANHCQYCESAHLAFCKILGVDQATRDHLMANIEELRPERTRDIIKVGTKMGVTPVTVTQDDYDLLRYHGVGYEELQEIVAMASFASFANITADTLQVPVDKDFHDILTT